MQKYSRRELIKCLMAGGMVTAAGLWTPGKLISIPSGKEFSSIDILGGQFRLIDRHTVEYVGDPDKVVHVKEFYAWLKEQASEMMRDFGNPDDLRVMNRVEMEPGYRMINPEHLTSGTLTQDSMRPKWAQGYDEKEIWADFAGLGNDTINTDKIYLQGESRPRERISYPDRESMNELIAFTDKPGVLYKGFR